MTTVEKIHRDFDNAHLSLLNPSIKQSRVPRLRALGFTPELMDADIAAYYNETYPFLKFMRIEDLDRICARYNLVYGPVSAFKGIVPEKNLKDIEDAPTLFEGDKVKDIYLHYIKFEEGYKNLPDVVTMNREYDISKMDNYFRDQGVNDKYKGICESIKIVHRKMQGLFIAAPKSQFDKEKLDEYQRGTLTFSFSQPKDPVVFRYCRGGIQVITKWGPEANDPELAVPVLN